VPRGHHLKHLFDRLSPPIQNRLEYLWETRVVPLRASTWDRIETNLNRKIPRDLRSALVGGNRAFEEVRYSYEGVPEEMEFIIGDLPNILGQLILELKPEWGWLRRRAEELSA
jgi:hypothetical protein